MSNKRYSKINQEKANGSTYTPKELGDFVADRLTVFFQNSYQDADKKIRILEPSLGDGVLIFSLIDKLLAKGYSNLEILGLDIDSQHFLEITNYLENNYPNISFKLINENFYDFYLESLNTKRFDLIIANPPYIRTQIMGEDKSKKIASIFNIKGKVDAYQAFMVGLTNLLDEFGCMATITSNKFLNIKSGKSVRKYLREHLNIREIIDLGDTRIFDEVAVLPALVFSQKNHMSNSQPLFKSLYQTNLIESEINKFSSIYEVLDLKHSQVVKIDENFYMLNVGVLNTQTDKEDIWVIENDTSNDWLSKVESKTWHTFDEVFTIKVGVKSTADKVFIKKKSDWRKLDSVPELLRDLITSEYANNFVCNNLSDPKQIIYPHIEINGEKKVANLELYPNSSKYFHENEKVLKNRDYVMKSNKNWYELWVAQDVRLWKQPKVIWTDISEKPKFWMDLTGKVVNGECFWLITKNEFEDDVLWLGLGVANSKFIEKYYDMKFNNKLYSGKRRFVKQYVSKFPLPDPKCLESLRIIELSREIVMNPNQNHTKKINEINELVSKIFLND